jgi:hypothetical protein
MRVSKTRLPVGAVLALAAAVSLSACGGSGSSGATLGGKIAAIKAAAKSATSVRVTGTLSPFTLDMVLTKSSGLSGTVSQQGEQYTVLVTGGKSYVLVTKAFLSQTQAPASACAKYCGKWVVVPAATGSELTAGLSLTQLVNRVFGKIPVGSGAGPKLTATQFDGQPAWLARSGSTSLYIARTGKTYLLGVIQGSQRVTFSDWDTATVPGTPPRSQVLQITTLVNG